MNLHNKQSGVRRRLIIAIVSAVVLITVAIIGVPRVIADINLNNQLDLGYKFLAEEKYEEAILAFEKAIQIDRKNVEARVHLAKAYVATNRIDDAEEILKRAIDMDSRKPEAYIKLAELYVKQNRIEDAVVLLGNGYDKTGDQNIGKILDESKEEMEKLKAGSDIEKEKNNEDEVSDAKNTDSDYILPASSERKLTAMDLEGLDSEKIDYARNEIYARHGYVFKTNKYKEYFGSKEWYTPNTDFKETDLNEVEKYNASFLKEYQSNNGASYLNSEQYVTIERVTSDNKIVIKDYLKIIGIEEYSDAYIFGEDTEAGYPKVLEVSEDAVIHIVKFNESTLQMNTSLTLSQFKKYISTQGFKEYYPSRDYFEGLVILENGTVTKIYETYHP